MGGLEWGFKGYRAGFKGGASDTLQGGLDSRGLLSGLP